MILLTVYRFTIGLLLIISHQSIAQSIIKTTEQTAAKCYPDVMSAYQVLVQNERKASAGVVNINTASVADLVALTGIGHNSAAAIVEYRNKHGRFTSVDELAKIKGIGKATIDKNRHRLAVMH